MVRVMGYVKNLLRIEPVVSLAWWVYERIGGSWTLLVSLFGGGLMYYLSAISDWLEPWGPIGWAAVGLATFLVLLFSIVVVGMGVAWRRGRDQLTEFSRRHLETASVNPLEEAFERKRFKADDFYHPFFEENHNKVFRNCEIVGPCNIVLNGMTNMPRAKFRECDWVIVDCAKPLHGAVGFNNSSFYDCGFYRITFFVEANFARDLKRQALTNGKSGSSEPLNIVSDGTFGRI